MVQVSRAESSCEGVSRGHLEAKKEEVVVVVPNSQA